MTRLSLPRTTVLRLDLISGTDVLYRAFRMMIGCKRKLYCYSYVFISIYKRLGTILVTYISDYSDPSRQDCRLYVCMGIEIMNQPLWLLPKGSTSQKKDSGRLLLWTCYLAYVIQEMSRHHHHTGFCPLQTGSIMRASYTPHHVLPTGWVNIGPEVVPLITRSDIKQAEKCPTLFTRSLLHNRNRTICLAM